MSERGLAVALTEAARAINAQHGLPETLKAIVDTALVSLDGIDHVGISLAHRGGRIETAAATDRFVLELDQLQYDLGEGPCVYAMVHEQTTLVQHARQEQRWPQFIPEAVRRGLRSQLALQLYFDDRTVAGLNMYSTSTDTLEQETVHTAELFAAHAAIALGRVREIDHLNQALASRKVIGQAIGVVMERYGITEHRAFAYLARASSTGNLKLRMVAERIVEGTESRGASREAVPGPADPVGKEVHVPADMSGGAT